MIILESLLHFIMGTLMLVMSGFFLYLYKTKKRSLSKHLALFFLFFGVYSSSIALPLILFPDNLIFTAYGFIIAAIAVNLVMLISLKTMVLSTHTKLIYYSNLLYKVVLLLGTLEVFVLIFDPRIPAIGAEGLIIWNLNPIAAWSLSISTALVALFWALVNFKNGNTTEDIDIYSKIKLFVFSIDGVMWSVAGFVYYISDNFLQTTAAFFFMILSMIITAFTFLLLSYLKKTRA